MTRPKCIDCYFLLDHGRYGGSGDPWRHQLFGERWGTPINGMPQPRVNASTQCESVRTADENLQYFRDYGSIDLSQFDPVADDNFSAIMFGGHALVPVMNTSWTAWNISSFTGSDVIIDSESWSITFDAGTSSIDDGTTPSTLDDPRTFEHTCLYARAAYLHMETLDTFMMVVALGLLAAQVSISHETRRCL